MGLGKPAKLKQGDTSISAHEFNRHVDAADIVLGQSLGTPHTPLRLDYDTNRATVKNASGADRRRGEIVGLGGSPLSDFGQGELWVSGVAPAADKRFGVLLDPIPN